MERIFLIQAYQGRKEPFGAIFPIGLCYIATPLTAMGKEVAIFDMNTADEPYGELEQAIRDFKPDIIGYSLRNIDTQNRYDPWYYFDFTSPTLQIAQKAAPSVPIIVGGTGFSLFPDKIMDRCPEIDIGVLHEGEDTFPDILENLDNLGEVKGIYYRDNGEIKFTGDRVLPPFEEIKFPRREYLDLQKYPLDNFAIGILSKRGCPLRCSYCNYPFLNGEKIRRSPVENVVDEIEYLINDFGINEFMFVDGVFNAPKKHAMQICQEIIDRGLNVRWKAWCDIKHFTDDFMDLAYAAGCRAVTFSPDGASDEALEAMQKGITVKNIQESFRIVRRFKDVTVGYGFFGMVPGQTFMGVMKTIYMFFKFNLMLYPRGGAHIGRIRIEPATNILEVALKEGFIDEDTELLPRDPAEIKNLFYDRPHLWFADWLMSLAIFAMKDIAKPTFRVLKRFIKRRPPGGPVSDPV